MNPYHNLPLRQRAFQRRVDQFNADEALWFNLEAKRLCRATDQGLSKAQREILDFLDLIGERPIAECIGFFGEG